MPDAGARAREAVIAEIRHALAAARCAARLAALESGKLAVRELLLEVIDQTARAEYAVACLVSTSFRDAVP